MYFIYRSRFQPKFSDPHKMAVKKFFDLQLELQLENAQLVLGIVDEALFLHIYSQNHQKKISKILEETLGKKAMEIYRFRFNEELNPTKKIGEIKKSMWENWHDLCYHRSEPIRYIIISHATWTGISLYKRDKYQSSTSQKSAKQSLLGEACEVLIRWLPSEAPKDIGWYFPIFDRDDLNDMGFIASLMADYFKQGNADLDRIVFARFNYENEKNYNFIFNRSYGAYAALLSATSGFKEFWNEQSDENKEGFEVVERSKVPFVFYWSQLIDIYDSIKKILERISKNTENPQLEQELKNIVSKIDDEIVWVKDPKHPYSKDLENFYIFMNYFKDNLLPKLTKLGLKEEVQKKFTGLTNMLLTGSQISLNDKWLEDSKSAKEKFNEIKNILNSI